MFSPDRPIEFESEDLLGRAPFAHKLAEAIEDWRERDSLVIALYGPWGSGKSSLKNLVKIDLEKSGDKSPLILEFNPWQFSGQEQVYKAFLSEIGAKLGQADKHQQLKKLAERWNFYSAYLQTGSFVFSGVRAVLVWSLLAVGVMGLSSAFLPQSKLVIIAVAIVAMAAAAALNWGGSFAEKISRLLASASSLQSKGLSEMKEELTGLLRNLKRPLLVVIDDVDRLDAKECLLLFQLVKANADFPNVVYLVLFERGAVEERISKFAGLEGPDYLEKIVQVGFDIPAADQTRVQDVLLAEIDKLLVEKQATERFDKRRWLNIFAGELSPYFQTLRDVRRFLSVLSFNISVFRNGPTFEVNPIDLIAIEALRIFEPNVYRNLPGAKETLTEEENPGLYGPPAEEAARKAVESVAEAAPESTRPRVREILKQLFPPVGWVFGGMHYDASHRGGWLRDLRVCHPEIFDRYFQMTIPEGDVSQADTERILSLTGDCSGLVKEFRAFNQRGLLDVVLGRFDEGYKDIVPLEHAVPFVTAIYDIGEEIQPKPRGITTPSPEMSASRIVHHYLKREADPLKRTSIMREALKATTGLFLAITDIAYEMDGAGRQKEPGSRLLPEDQVPGHQAICLEKIRDAARSGSLKTNPRLLRIMYIWREWVPEEPVKWAGEMSSSSEGALALLVAFLQPVSSQALDEHVRRTQWVIDLKQLEQFASIDVLQQKLEALERESLNDKQRIAMEAFRKALKGREKGKNGIRWMLGDDGD